MKLLRTCLLLVAMLVLSCPLALAYTDQGKVAEEAEADFMKVRRLAVAAPLYMPVREAPSYAELQQVLEATPTPSKRKSPISVVTYEVMVQNIIRDKNIDIRKTERHAAAKIFRDNVTPYADAYVLLTIANSSRPCFYFDVFQAGTNNLLYSYQIITDSDEKEDVKTYTMLVDQFYKAMNLSMEETGKKLEKEARDAAKAKKKKEDKK